MATTATTELQKYLLFGMEYVWIRLEEALEGLTDEQIKWRPYDANNSIGAIFLHMGKMNDNSASGRFLKVPHLWSPEGDDWKAKFNYPDPAEGTRFEAGWSFDLMPASENKITLVQLEEYYLASQKRVVEAIMTTPQDFLDIPVEDGNPHHAGWTNASWLLHIPLHMSHHQAQIDYISGLVKAGKAQ
jgi:hypothetical protein